MSEPAVEIARDCLAVRLRSVNRRITRLYDEALRPVGLRVGQLNLLVAIERGLRGARALAARLEMDPSTLSRDLEHLKKAGWVSSTEGEDRRQRDLVLTDSGRALLVDALPLWRRAQEEASLVLGPLASALR